MAKGKWDGERQSANPRGYAIRTVNGGYFDINGIGDWSLAGEVTTCGVFETVEAAVECLEDNHLLDDDTLSIVAISRAVAAVASPCPEADVALAKARGEA